MRTDNDDIDDTTEGTKNARRKEKKVHSFFLWFSTMLCVCFLNKSITADKPALNSTRRLLIEFSRLNALLTTKSSSIARARGEVNESERKERHKKNFFFLCYK